MAENKVIHREARPARLSAARPAPEHRDACEWVPAHEPWSCRVHGGIRTRLDVEVCSRIVPARLESEDTAAHLAWLRDGGRLARALGSTGCGHSSCPRDTSRHDEEAAAILDALTNPTTQEVTPHG